MKRLNPVLANSLLSLGAVLLTLVAAEGVGRMLSRLAPRHLHPCVWCRQLRPLLSEERPTGAELPEPKAESLPSGPPSPIPGNKEVTRTVQTQPEDYIVNDPAGYLRPIPGRTYVATRKRGNGDLIYRARYTIDRFGRRTHLRGTSAGKRDRFLLFLGCSYVFGEGLNDEETLPAQVSKFASRYSAYNYGFHGYGPGSVYLRLKNTNLRQEVSESRGIAVYFFLNDHLNRMLGSMSLVSTWGAYLPDVEEDAASGDLEFRGSFESARPVLTPIFQFLGSSSLLRYLAVDFPLSLTDEKRRLFARIVRGMKEQVRSQLGLDEFFVVFYPGAYAAKLLVPELVRQGIRSLDLSDWGMNELTQGSPEIPWDGHPSVAFNRVLAQELSRFWMADQLAQPATITRAVGIGTRSQTPRGLRPTSAIRPRSDRSQRAWSK